MSSSTENPGLEYVRKMSLGVTTSGEVSKDDFLRAYNMLKTMAFDEDRPCRRNESGKEMKSDMTPAMKKAKEQFGTEKRGIQDEEVKKMTESGRSLASAEDKRQSPETDKIERKRKTGIQLNNYFFMLAFNYFFLFCYFRFRRRF